MSLIFNDKERVGAWVAEQVEQTASWGSFYAMGVERDGEIIGGIVVNNYNGSNATGHIAFDRPCREMPALVAALFDYAFRQCGLRRFTAMIPESRRKAVNFVQKVGFELEFIMRAGAPDGEDMLVFVMWPEKCRWLGGSA